MRVILPSTAAAVTIAEMRSEAVGLSQHDAVRGRDKRGLSHFSHSLAKVFNCGLLANCSS